MMKSHGSQDDHYEANVWPAVTDSFLLIASIFIVLSVVSLTTVATKLHDYQFEKPGSEGTVCWTWSLEEKGLFGTNKSELLNKAETASRLKKILREMSEGLDELIPTAEDEWGAGKFYIVLEVAGHTDETGNRDRNWALSTERAITVIQLAEKLLSKDLALKTALNINDRAVAKPGATILRAAGYCYNAPYESIVQSGKKLPKKELDEARKSNRRVEIRLFAQPVPLVHRTKVMPQ